MIKKFKTNLQFAWFMLKSFIIGALVIGFISAPGWIYMLPYIVQCIIVGIIFIIICLSIGMFLLI